MTNRQLIEILEIDEKNNGVRQVIMEGVIGEDRFWSTIESYTSLNVTECGGEVLAIDWRC